MTIVTFQPLEWKIAESYIDRWYCARTSGVINLMYKNTEFQHFLYNDKPYKTLEQAQEAAQCMYEKDRIEAIRLKVLDIPDSILEQIKTLNSL